MIKIDIRSNRYIYGRTVIHVDEDLRGHKSGPSVWG